MAPILETKRLLLRKWKKSDFDLYAKINADKMVMEFFPKTLNREESTEQALKIQKELNEKNYGLWAIEVKNKDSFIGFIGLHEVDFKAHFTPCIEIGWRLAFDYWNMGYATEVARRVIKYAFEELKLDEIVAFTSVLNTRSIKVMKKLNMVYDEKGDFFHPKILGDSPLKKHVLYRLKNPYKILNGE